MVLNTFLVIASVGFSLLIIEAVLHFTPLEERWLYPLEPGGYLKYDPELGFDIRPSFPTSTHSFYDYSYKVWSNELGCYDYPYDGVSPYIYVTGDSFAWGFTPLHEKWGKALESMTGIRTLTCGVNAYGTRQEVIKTRRTLDRLSRDPELIVVSYLGENDPFDDFAFPNFTSYRGYRVPSWSHCGPETLLSISPLMPTTTCNIPEPHYSLFERTKFELSLNSIIYMIAKRQFNIQDTLKSWLAQFAPGWAKNQGLLHAEGPQFVDGTRDVSWDAHMYSMRSFKDLAEMHNARAVFVLVPHKEMTRAASIDPQAPNERLKEYLTAQGIEYVDLTPEFRAREKLPERPLYWDFDGHWNIAGNRLAGLIVTKALLEKGLVDIPNKSQVISDIEKRLAEEFPA